MTWSTRELAHLAGTTINTVRHYHSLGLLEAPERRCNGYKQYRVHHLVRLIRLRRLVELGVPLARVDTAGDDEIELLVDLRAIDEQVEAEIERLCSARADIGALLRVGAPVDTPRGFEAIAGDLSTQDRALIHILTRLHDEDDVHRLKVMVVAESARGRSQFDALPPNAAEIDRRRTADLLDTGSANWRSTDRPWREYVGGHRRGSSQEIREALVETITELYNPAQRDVLLRLGNAGRLDARSA